MAKVNLACLGAALNFMKKPEAIFLTVVMSSFAPTAFATSYQYNTYDSRGGFSYGNINVQEYREPQLIQQQVPDYAGSIMNGYEAGQRIRLRQQQIEYYENLNSQN